MIEAQIYVNETRLDLFESATISLTDKLKEAQDIATIFTPFTQSFTVPASKTNNIIFQHYYSFNVIDGFDARRKHDAIIKLNGADFKSGYIKLLGVDLKDEVPDRYRIQFIGELSSLKDKFGDDMLEDLPGFDKYNHTYDLTTVTSGLQLSLVYDDATQTMVEADDTTINGEIIYPFISHTRGFRYSTTNGLYDITADTGSLTNPDRLSYTDLKPAIKVKTIFDEIASHYGLNFAGQLIADDFGGTSPIEDMYMWMHRDKGYLTYIDDNNDFSEVFRSDIYEYTTGSIIDERDTQAYHNNVFSVDILAGSGDCRITVEIKRNGQPYGSIQTTFASADTPGSVSFELGAASGAEPTWPYPTEYWTVQCVVETTNSGNISLIDPELKMELWEYEHMEEPPGWIQVGSDIIEFTGSVSPVKQVVVSRSLPKMKVIDFIQGMFRTFNIAGYGRAINNLSDTQEIAFDYYQDYMSRGRLIDITKYVDPSTSSVERVNPYGYLAFKYPDPKTFLAKKHNEIFRDDFGCEELDTKDLTGDDSSFLFDGGKFEVTLPFEKMMYERLKDLDDDSASSILYGWFVNDFKENTPEPEIGEPLLFFRVSEPIVDGIDLDDGSTLTTGNYNRPSNVRSDESLTLHFGAEYDEWTILEADATENVNSLFDTYYRSHLVGIFSPNARLKKINANLPPKFLLYYRLNDKLKIGNVVYNISSIESNIKTGDAQLELIRLTNETEIYAIERGDCYAIDYVTEPYWCSDPITLSLTP
jgi:hypothetical protein